MYNRQWAIDNGQWAMAVGKFKIQKAKVNSASRQGD